MLRIFFIYFAGYMLSVVNSMSLPYTVHIENIKHCSEKTDFININGLKLKKVDQTTIQLDGNIDIKQNISPDNTISIKAYQLKNGKWTPTILSVNDQNICSFVESDKIYFPTLRQQNPSIPAKCPFSKDVYSFNGSKLALKKLPLMLPLGCYKLEMTIRNKYKKEIACISGVGKVTRQNEETTSKCLSK